MRRSLTLLLIILVSLLAGAQDEQEQKRPPSTPEERKRFLTLVHKLEKTPLDQSLNSEITWALQWLQDIPDVNINMCFSVLGRFDGEQYRYESRIHGQFVLGMGAFLMEHPQKSADNVAIYMAGIESALKTYKSILKSKPDAKSRGLDDLLSKQEEGQLADSVREASKDCEDTGQT